MFVINSFLCLLFAQILVFEDETVYEQSIATPSTANNGMPPRINCTKKHKVCNK